ncbi:uncharacterized protein METZ01_LOCUS384797, partial [marine metagenome]
STTLRRGRAADHNPAVAYCDQIVFDHDYW